MKSWKRDMSCQERQGPALQAIAAGATEKKARRWRASGSRAGVSVAATGMKRETTNGHVCSARHHHWGLTGMCLAVAFIGQIVRRFVIERGIIGIETGLVRGTGTGTEIEMERSQETGTEIVTGTGTVNVIEIEKETETETGTGTDIGIGIGTETETGTGTGIGNVTETGAAGVQGAETTGESVTETETETEIASAVMLERSGSGLSRLTATFLGDECARPSLFGRFFLKMCKQVELYRLFPLQTCVMAAIQGTTTHRSA